MVDSEEIAIKYEAILRKAFSGDSNKTSRMHSADEYRNLQTAFFDLVVSNSKCDEYARNDYYVKKTSDIKKKYDNQCKHVIDELKRASEILGVSLSYFNGSDSHMPGLDGVAFLIGIVYTKLFNS